MNEGLIPGRYAKALLKFAEERGAQARLYTLMANLSQSFAENPALDSTVANPFVAPDKKLQVLTTAAGATKADTAYADFLLLLKKNNRLPLIRLIAGAYRDDYRRANNIYRVDITTAAPLSTSDETRLKALIASHLKGATIEYSFAVNPELIGGFTIDIGSERLDASIRKDLKEFEHKILG